jgi:hypothetical protein
MSRQSFIFAVTSLFLVLLLCQPGRGEAQLYTYTLITDSTGPFSTFSGFPSISSLGTVSFIATLDRGEAGLFTSDGNAISTIVDTSGPISSFGSFPAINSSGAVAFRGTLDGGGQGIFIGNNASCCSTIASIGSQFSGFNGVAINAGGTVVFDAAGAGRPGLITGETGIFTGTGGNCCTTITNMHVPLIPPTIPAINDAGTVAFVGPNQDAIFTGNAISCCSKIVEGEGFGSPSINLAETVIFPGRGVILSGSALTCCTIIADDPGIGAPPAAFPSINNAGTVAFLGSQGIFTVSDQIRNTVIQTGDLLFGSTVIDVSFARGLNDAGQIAFGFSLADGRSGIARADVIPEPGTFVLVASGLACLALILSNNPGVLFPHHVPLIEHYTTTTQAVLPSTS